MRWIKRSEPETLRPEAKEVKQEYWWKLVKGNLPALKGRKGIAIRGKQQGSAQKETLVVSATMRTRSSFPAPEPQTKSDRKNFFETTVSQRPESVWEEISKTVQRLRQWDMHELLVWFLARFSAISTMVWWNVEEHMEAEETEYFNIALIHRTRNSLP